MGCTHSAKPEPNNTLKYVPRKDFDGGGNKDEIIQNDKDVPNTLNTQESDTSVPSQQMDNKGNISLKDIGALVSNDKLKEMVSNVSDPNSKDGVVRLNFNVNLRLTIGSSGMDIALNQEKEQDLIAKKSAAQNNLVGIQDDQADKMDKDIDKPELASINGIYPDKHVDVDEEESDDPFEDMSDLDEKEDTPEGHGESEEEESDDPFEGMSDSDGDCEPPHNVQERSVGGIDELEEESDDDDMFGDLEVDLNLEKFSYYNNYTKEIDTVRSQAQKFSYKLGFGMWVQALKEILSAKETQIASALENAHIDEKDHQVLVSSISDTRELIETHSARNSYRHLQNVHKHISEEKGAQEYIRQRSTILYKKEHDTNGTRISKKKRKYFQLCLNQAFIELQDGLYTQLCQYCHKRKLTGTLQNFRKQWNTMMDNYFKNESAHVLSSLGAPMNLLLTFIRIVEQYVNWSRELVLIKRSLFDAKAALLSELNTKTTDVIRRHTKSNFRLTVPQKEKLSKTFKEQTLSIPE